MRRLPSIPLRPYVQYLWSSDHGSSRVASAEEEGFCEHVLPSGAMHIAIRLDDSPLRVFDACASRFRDIGHAVVGGARMGFYVKVAESSRSVGALLRPGAARALLGPAANAFAGQHAMLDDVCGRAATRLRDRLRETASPAQRLVLFEAWLGSRIGRPFDVPAAVIAGLGILQAGGTVAQAVSAGGCSHRRFIRLYEESVGLTPKRHARVLRFGRWLARIAACPGANWAELALDAGYADQSHGIREFRELAGLTPVSYRRVAISSPYHVRMRMHGGFVAGQIPSIAASNVRVG